MLPQIWVRNMVRGGILTAPFYQPLLGSHGGGDTLTVFAHLQIIAQVHRAADHVVRPGREVHVTNWQTGKYESRYQFGKIICSNAVSIPGIEQGALPTEISSLVSRDRTSSQPKGGVELTKGATMVPTISATTYPQAGRVIFSLRTTARPRTKLMTSNPMYHVHGVSL